MTQYNLANVSEIEGDVTPDSLVAKLDQMIHSSSAVEARVEKLASETGEYAIVLHGFLGPDDGGNGGNGGGVILAAADTPDTSDEPQGEPQGEPQENERSDPEAAPAAEEEEPSTTEAEPR